MRVTTANGCMREQHYGHISSRNYRTEQAERQLSASYERHVHASQDATYTCRMHIGQVAELTRDGMGAGHWAPHASLSGSRDGQMPRCCGSGPRHRQQSGEYHCLEVPFTGCKGSRVRIPATSTNA